MKRKQTTVVILPTPEEKVARLYANPIHQFLVTKLTKATDQELIEYGEAIAAVLGLLVGWAKRACVGMANTDDLRRLFYTAETPLQVRDLLDRIIKLVS